MGRVDPACTRSSLFLMGQDGHGNWVVQDQRGVCGELFADRATALRFAMYENGNRPQAVVMVPGVFELDMKRGRTTSTGCRALLAFSTIDAPLNGWHPWGVAPFARPLKTVRRDSRLLEEAERLRAVADQHVLGLLVVVEHHLVRSRGRCPTSCSRRTPRAPDRGDSSWSTRARPGCRGRSGRPG